MARIQGFNFQPIVAPFTPLPIQEFGATVDSKVSDYNEALEYMSKYEQAQAAIKTAPLDTDKAYLDEINMQFNNQFDNIRGLKDYENQLTKLKMLSSDYASKITPIVQRQKEIDDFTKALYSNPNIKNHQAAIEYIEKAEELNPSIIKDDQGRVYNRLNLENYGFLMNNDINLLEHQTKLASLMKASIKEKFPQIVDLKDGENTVAKLMEQVKTSGLSKKEIKDTLEAGILADADLQAYRTKMIKMEELGVIEEGTFQKELDAAILAASMSQSFSTEDRQYNILGNFIKDLYGNKEEKPTDVETRHPSVAIPYLKKYNNYADFKKEKLEVDQALEQDSNNLTLLAKKLKLDNLEAILLSSTEDIKSEDLILLDKYKDKTTTELLSYPFQSKDNRRSTMGETLNDLTEIGKVIYLRNKSESVDAINKEIENLSSFSPQVNDLPIQAKVENTNSTVGQVLSQKFLDNLNSYDLVGMDQTLLNDQSDIMKEIKDKIKDIAGKSPTDIAKLQSDIQVTGYTDTPIMGSKGASMAYKINMKNATGENVTFYAVPRAGYETKFADELLQYKSEKGNNSSLQRVVDYKNLKQLSSSVKEVQETIESLPSANEVETFFAELTGFTPSLLAKKKEGIDINRRINEQPNENSFFNISSDGKQFIVTMGSKTEKFNTMSEIRNYYYAVLNSGIRSLVTSPKK